MGQDVLQITIQMTGPGQLTINTNAPPGHFLSMLEAAKASFIQGLMRKEAEGGSIIVAPSGSKIR